MGLRITVPLPGPFTYNITPRRMFKPTRPAPQPTESDVRFGLFLLVFLAVLAFPALVGMWGMLLWLVAIALVVVRHRHLRRAEQAHDEELNTTAPQS